jgi:hypothetical protein
MLRRALQIVLGSALAASAPLFLAGPSLAGAAEPAAQAVERSVVTNDGAMYRGEVVDYVVGDHITLKLDNGEIKRIPFSDAARISPASPKGQSVLPAAPILPTPTSPSPPPPVSAPPPPVVAVPAATASVPVSTGGVRPTIAANPVATVVAPGTWRMITLRDDLTVNGEILEYEVGSHILCKLVDGDKRRIAWTEAKKIAPPRTLRDDVAPNNSPERTIVLRDGKTLRGELVESLLGEWTRLKLGNGQLIKVAWHDAKRILLPQQGSGSTIPVTAELLVSTDSGSRVQGEYFEHIPDEHLVLRHASGRLRVIPVGTIRKIVVLQENAGQ